jgi:hypothetical protein
MPNATTRSLRFGPQPGPQSDFLSTSADIAIYGGAAGGGKSWALCYCPIRHVRKLGFAGVVFRRTSPEITNSGGLWDQASELYPAAGGRGVRGDLEFRFRNNVRISFRHLEHEQSKFGYQGAAFCYLGFDELTHFTESQFFYMLSRNRSTCGVRPYVRGSCNPHPGWVKRFLAPWVDEEFKGTPAKPGELRWFTRVQGEVRWVPRGTKHAKSVTFIRASVYDNPALLEANPEYVDNLMALPEIEQQRLLYGNWRVRHEGLVYPAFEKCMVHAPMRLEVPPTHGGIDWGFRNPFAAIWGHFDGDDCLWITGGRYRSGVALGVHSEHLPRGVEWWVDPADPESAQELRLADHWVRQCTHMSTRGASGEKRSPKMSGIAQVFDRMESGRLKIVVCEETKPLLRELGLYAYDPSKFTEEPIDVDNHSPDALRYLIVGHDRGKVVTDREAPEAREVRTFATTEQRRIEEIKANMRDWQVYDDDIPNDFLTSDWEN